VPDFQDLRYKIYPQSEIYAGLAENRERKGVFVLTNDAAIGYKTGNTASP
jgi:hypothetical protein